MSEILEIEGLVEKYGDLVAVKGVRFAVEEGEVFGLLGPNGAGKTTLELYFQGLLDDGSHLEDFAEWAGHYKLKLKRETALKRFSQQRVQELHCQAEGGMIELARQEPVLELA